MINWKAVCTNKGQGGVGVRNLAILNGALLGNGFGDLLRISMAFGRSAPNMITRILVEGLGNSRGLFGGLMEGNFTGSNVGL